VEQWRFNQTNTQKTKVKGIANLQWAASDLPNPQSLTRAAVACGLMALCIWPGSAVRLHTPELRHYCTLSWLFSRCWFWPSSFPAV